MRKIIIFSLLLLGVLNSIVFTYAAEENVIEWQGEQAGGKLTKDVKLVGDTYMTSLIQIDKNITVTIDLNGYMLKGNGKSTIIVNNGKLTIKDSRPDYGSHKFKKTTTGPWTLDENGDVEIKGGIITGGRDFTSASAGSSGGGAIQQKSNNTSNVLFVEGGTLVGNSSTRAGGAIYGGAVTMNGGKIIGNFAELFGGGVSVSGSFYMNGGSIEQNETYAKSSYNKPTSASFYDNASVIIGQSSSFVMTGGELIGNMSTVKNATSSPKFVMTNGFVKGKFRILNGLKAEISGGTLNGSISIYKGSCIVSDSALIYGGTLENGGSVYIDGGNFEMKGGLIKDSNAVNGGAVYIKGGNFNMSDGEIHNCKANNDGGAIYMSNGNFNMTGGTIEGCSTGNAGGVVYIANGNFTMESGVLSNNVSNNVGGALRVESGDVDIGLETCEMPNEVHECPLILNNTAKSNGGAISMGNGVLRIHCGKIEHNIAINNQNSNAIYLTGGIIKIFGGETQSGFLIMGGKLEDLRDGQRQISYNAIYDDVNITILEYVETGTLLKLTNDIFERNNFHIVGWSLDANNTQGYMEVGDEIYITSNIEIYAVWNQDSSYMVFIPPQTINDDGKTTFTLDATTETFDPYEKLDIKINDMENKLYFDLDEEQSVGYEIIEESTSRKINSGDKIATFTKEDSIPKKYYITLKEKPKYSGKYTNTISFTIEYGIISD